RPVRDHSESATGLALACCCSGSHLVCRRGRHLAARNGTSERGTDGDARTSIGQARCSRCIGTGGTPAATLNRYSGIAGGLKCEWLNEYGRDKRIDQTAQGKARGAA